MISHSDKDHYKGFEYIFKNDKIRIYKIFHNGIVERPGESSAFGKIANGYITTLVQDTAEMLKLLENPDKRKGTNSMYLKTLHHVLKHNPEVVFKNLSIEDEHLMAFDSDNQIEGKKFEVEVLGPIMEEKNQKKVLKSINNAGKDKNGHSVLLKLIYDKVRILLGGDINTEFGEMIHDYYKSKNQSERLVMDVAKACHHGSNHFHYGFLETLNPIATVISSGDNESYAHPRPDAVGAFGKTGYSKTPLIFSTELARSNKEITKLTITKIADKLEKIKQNENTSKDLEESGDVFKEEIKKLKAKNRKLNKEVNSYITKFGMINLRTDGQNMIIAQKLEKPAAYGKWDIHPLTYKEDTGRFEHDDTH